MPAISFAKTNTQTKAKLVFVFATVSCFSAIGKTLAMPDPVLFSLGRGHFVFSPLASSR
jgi:hypothetical protein